MKRLIFVLLLGVFFASNTFASVTFKKTKQNGKIIVQEIEIQVKRTFESEPVPSELSSLLSFNNKTALWSGKKVKIEDTTRKIKHVFTPKAVKIIKKYSVSWNEGKYHILKVPPQIIDISNNIGYLLLAIFLSLLIITAKAMSYKHFEFIDWLYLQSLSVWTLLLVPFLGLMGTICLFSSSLGGIGNVFCFFGIFIYGLIAFATRVLISEDWTMPIGFDVEPFFTIIFYIIIAGIAVLCEIFVANYVFNTHNVSVAIEYLFYNLGIISAVNLTIILLKTLHTLPLKRR